MSNLQQLLREHDPANDRELADHEVTRIRARMLAEKPQRRRVTPIARFAFAAVLLVLILGGWAAVRARQEKEIAAPASEPRQIRYTTPGGTRIVWSLDPDFQL